MSWCDKLASVPSVGFKLDPHFAPGDSIMSAFSPILDKLMEGNHVAFTVNRHESFSAEFTTENGYTYGADQGKVYVNFQHRLRAKATSGGPPVMEMLSRPLPFTELLPEVAGKLVEATLMMPGIPARKLHRVGIVATTSVAQEELPPGIARFIKYMGRPWMGLVDAFSINITADLKSTSSQWSDRCIHTLTKPEEDPDQLLTLKFDWQRTFTSPRPTTQASLKEVLAAAEKEALKYFEDLAEGSRFDEQLISAAD